LTCVSEAGVIRLYEFQAKRIFEENGIPIPRGSLCRTPGEAMEAAKKLAGPVVLKAQVLVGGRGLAGGIKFGEDSEEVGKLASQVLDTPVKDERPSALLVEQRLEVTRELYAGVTYDYRQKRPVVLASSRGGVDIETVARENPADMAETRIDPFKGFNCYQARELAAEIQLTGNELVQYSNILSALWNVFRKHDAELVEANPLAVLPEGKLVALDAKMSLDDKSVARQSSMLNRIGRIPPSQTEGLEARRARAKELGIPTYIEMQGNMGIVADGAGSGMLTLDLVTDYGGKTRVYCEMGGETTAELMENTLLAALAVKDLRVVLINLIGGLNLMDEMAKGITSYLRKHPTKVPIIVRMSGTNQDEGRRILTAGGIRWFDSLDEAVEKAVGVSRGH